MPDLIVAFETHDGREVELPSTRRGRTQREWAEVWSVAGVTAPVTPATLLFFPALILVCIIMAWVTLMLALIGTRFRDLQPIIATILQLFFFVTPLIWDRDQIAGRAHPIWVDINPFYHIIEIMRAPMLGKVPPLYWHALIGAPLLPALAVAARAYGWSPSSLGLGRGRLFAQLTTHSFGGEAPEKIIPAQGRESILRPRPGARSS